MYYLTTYSSPVGILTIACRDNKIVGLWIEGQKYHGQLLEKAIAKDDCEIFCRLKNWLDRYFEGGKPAIEELPLAPEGSGFRQNVWKILCRIPYGKTITYGDIANEMASESGKRQSCRAIGGAVGHNPVSIIIPCHRVVGANGSMTGYAGGIQKKVALLKHEGSDILKFSIKSVGK